MSRSGGISAAQAAILSYLDEGRFVGESFRLAEFTHLSSYAMYQALASITLRELAVHSDLGDNVFSLRITGLGRGRLREYRQSLSRRS